MSETFPVKIIAHIHTDFPTKFGVPRQSGLIDSLESLIIFEPEYRDPLSAAWAGGVFPSVADLAVFQGRARYLVPHRAPAKAGRKPPRRCLCNPLALPAKCHRAVLGAAFGN